MLKGYQLCIIDLITYTDTVWFSLDRHIQLLELKHLINNILFFNACIMILYENAYHLPNDSLRCLYKCI